MEGSVWIGMGSLAVTMLLAIAGAAVTLGRLMANVQNLTSVVETLVAESRVDNEGLVEMRSLVATLRETVSGLQDTLRTGFANRISLLERRLDVLESAHHRNHAD